MKKILSIVVLILLISSLSGCMGVKTFATDREIEEFIEKLEENFTENDYSYKFTTTSNYKEKNKKGTEIFKQTVKGVVTVDYFDGYYSKSYDISGTIKEKTVTPTLKGKEVEKSNVKESIIYLSAAHRSKDEGIYYIDSKVTNKDEDGKTKKNIKTTDRYVKNLSVVDVESLISDMVRENNYFYVKGNKYKVVVNGSNYVKEYVVVFDGDDIKSIKYTYESHYSKTVTKIKFVDYTDIEKPKNASDYESD